MADDHGQRFEAAVTPYLEPGERIVAAFVGQSRLPPSAWWFVGGPFELFLIVRRHTVVATERHVYVLQHKWLRNFLYVGAPYKVPGAYVRLESGANWARIDGGPKLYLGGTVASDPQSLDHFTAVVQWLQGGGAQASAGQPV